ncbi:hypothetical protein BJX61DRAFT_359040 [Aspergillus egyptiacus]|nr:hypothetical protein BJX61DRAFT_359040 [Aspergillus egyptiacus]
MSKSNPQPPPANHLTFDPWNSASTGHQISDSTPGTAWQRTREAKLAQQFRTGDCTVNSFVYKSSQRVYEKGEWEWDWGGDARGGRGHDGASARNGKGMVTVERDSKQRDIRSMIRVNKGPGVGVGLGSGLQGKKGSEEEGKMEKTADGDGDTHASMPVSAYKSELQLEPGPVVFGDLGASTGVLNLERSSQTQKQMQMQTQAESKPSCADSSVVSESTILRGATIYIDGQTAPLISDHKLKGLLVAHGATLAISLSRRVTHVIIGKPNSGPGRGAGGGLAAGKLQKEIQRGGWRGMKIVGVEWVLESIKTGKRLPETRFAINLSNQRSVLKFM